MKRIFYITKGDRNTASTYCRVYNFIDCYREKNISVFIKKLKVIPINEISFKRLEEFYKNIKFLSKTKKNETIILQKAVFQYDYLILLFFFKIAARKFVFDYDDMTYKKGHSFLKTLILLVLSNKVFAGNNILYKFSRKFNNNTYLIPTGIDHTFFDLKKNKNKNEVIIGWIGNGKIHFNNILIIRSVLVHLLKKYNNLRLLFIDTCEGKLDQIFPDSVKKQVCVSEKSNQNIIKTNIIKFDIGIMPLIKNEFNSGKCGAKILLYNAVGIPALCTGIGENVNIVRNGETGFLCEDEKEWMEKLEFLINNKKTSEKMGKKAKKFIRKKYSNKIIFEKIMRILGD